MGVRLDEQTVARLLSGVSSSRTELVDVSRGWDLSWAGPCHQEHGSPGLREGGRPPCYRSTAGQGTVEGRDSVNGTQKYTVGGGRKGMHDKTTNSQRAVSQVYQPPGVEIPSVANSLISLNGLGLFIGGSDYSRHLLPVLACDTSSTHTPCLDKDSCAVGSLSTAGMFMPR